jgi:hypothetical protein
MNFYNTLLVELKRIQTLKDNPAELGQSSFTSTEASNTKLDVNMSYQRRRATLDNDMLGPDLTIEDGTSGQKKLTKELINQYITKHNREHDGAS